MNAIASYTTPGVAKRRHDQSGKTDQIMAAEEEDRSHRENQSTVGRSLLRTGEEK